LADRRLRELRAKVGGSRISADAKLTFAQAGKMWLEADKHAIRRIDAIEQERTEVTEPRKRIKMIFS